MTAPVPRSRLVAALCAGLLALVLAGCGSDTPAGSDYPPAGGGSAAGSSSAASTSSGPASSSQTTGRSVTATESEFAIDLSSPQLAAGTYTFTVTNAGKGTNSLPIEGPDGVDATSDTLQGGQSTTMTVTLQPSRYQVYCPIGNHRSMGMDTTLTVQ